ncbi:unnamed protein product [Lampetra planeri]
MNSTVCVVGGGNKATTTNAGRERVFIAAEVLAPNTIDFSTVFTKFDLVSNGAVFAAVIVIILLYLIMLLWARKADIKDNEKRISCCVTLLFLMMIANAMWFGKKQAANGAGGGVTVGPLSLIDVLISLLSSLVEVPVSLVVVLIFRNSRSESERSPGQKSSWRGPWPGGCRCVAWCLVVLAVLSSGFFTILYSMEWGPEKANRWLVRFLSSFFISVILVQPVKRFQQLWTNFVHPSSFTAVKVLDRRSDFSSHDGSDLPSCYQGCLL